MKRRIVKQFRQGYYFWRIAKDNRTTVDNVLEILVDAGLVCLALVEARKVRGR